MDELVKQFALAPLGQEEAREVAMQLDLEPSRLARDARGDVWRLPCLPDDLVPLVRVAKRPGLRVMVGSAASQELTMVAGDRGHGWRMSVEEWQALQQSLEAEGQWSLSRGQRKARNAAMRHAAK